MSRSALASTFASAASSLAAITTLACSNGASTPVIDRAPPPTVTGEWGGDHIGLTLGSASGTVQYDCAHGSLAAAVRPGVAGAFDVDGFHVREHGGPVREGEAVDSVPAHYLGAIAGDRMQLRVVIAGGDTLGPFELRRGEAPRVYRCL